VANTQAVQGNENEKTSFTTETDTPKIGEMAQCIETNVEDENQKASGSTASEADSSLDTFKTNGRRSWKTCVEKMTFWMSFLVAKTKPCKVFIAGKASPWIAFIGGKADPWKASVAAKVNRWRDDKTARWVALSAILLLVISFFIGSGGSSTDSMTSMSAYAVGSMCGDPIKTVQPWHVRTFEPRWFGWFGNPVPLTYYTMKGSKAHQISFVALDKRNIEVRLLIDDKDQGYRPVEIDNTVHCGDDVGKCIELGFAVGAIVVPGGKHTVKAEIVNHDITFRWGRERKRRIMWMVQECPA
jgi:hypothetical protein